jgi:hypothetical protein
VRIGAASKGETVDLPLSQRGQISVSACQTLASSNNKVNGTHKKPEATTIRKIRSYLRRGSQVSVLLNVKEYSDAYEFEDDGEDLGRHGGPAKSLRQTEEALAAALRPEQLMAGQCVQGLLAFSGRLLGRKEERRGRLARSCHGRHEDRHGRVVGPPVDLQAGRAS